MKIRFTTTRFLRLAAFLALAGLVFMVWSLVDPRPIPIMAAMSIGQGLGMVSFGMFLIVVLVDAWRASRRAPPDEDSG